MPSWPGFVLSVISKFVSTNTCYFDSHAPHRMLRQEGTLAARGPEATTELLRFYIAGTQANNAVDTQANPTPAR